MVKTSGVPPVSISHGNLLRFVTSLTRPVSAACRRTYSLFTLHYSLNPPGIVTGWKPRRSPKPPLPKGGASATPRRGDSAGKACGTSYLFPLHYSLKTFPFPHGFVLWWSANCESLSHASGVPAPFHKGACGQWPLTISHDSFQRFVASLTRPVSAACPPNLFPLP